MDANISTRPILRGKARAANTARTSLSSLSSVAFSDNFPRRGEATEKTFFLNIITTTTAYIIHCIGNKPSPNTESNELGSLIHEHQNSFHELPRLCL
ncbi:Hypothetical protein Bbr_0823 [Bifidobacterium breve UCC2003]|nr:Hypothetical protein Bbr_0823 [Bifidobacterium breve UCC2003]